MEPSDFKISISVESYDAKTAEITEILRSRKAHNIKTMKDIDPKF